MTFAQTMRLIWIDAVIAIDGKLNRADICTAFHVTATVAASDLKAFMTMFPGRLFYDGSRKEYRSAPLTGPVYPYKCRVAVCSAVVEMMGVMEDA